MTNSSHFNNNLGLKTRFFSTKNGKSAQLPSGQIKMQTTL